DARVADVAADGKETPSLAPTDAQAAVPQAAVEEDARHPGKRLGVVEEGGLVEQAVGADLGGAVARLAAAVLQDLDQGALLAADVPAGADEDFQVELLRGAASGGAADAQAFR